MISIGGTGNITSTESLAIVGSQNVTLTAMTTGIDFDAYTDLSITTTGGS